MIDICGCNIDKFKIGKRVAADDNSVNDEDNYNWSSGIVFVSTTEQNLRQFAKAIELQQPIILQGEVGVGKSFLIKELSRKLNCTDSLIELSIDDQTDSKSLFGAYISSEVPGEFIWQPGVITKAVVNGSWLVVEDIDRVPTDVIASLVPLLERRRLPAPERGPGAEIDAHPAFRIIGTQTIRHQTRQLGDNYECSGTIANQVLVSTNTLLEDVSNSTLPNMKFLSNLWLLVPVLSLSRTEIELVFERRYPGLIPTVVSSLMRTYDSLSAVGRTPAHTMTSNTLSSTSSLSLSTSSSILVHRPMTLKDIVKIGSRIEQIHSYQFNRAAGLLTEAQTILCLQEVIDVYAASSRRSDHFLQLIQQLAVCWGVPSMLLDTFVTQSQPQLILPNLDILSSEDPTMSVSIGRVHFERPSMLDLSTHRMTSLEDANEAALRFVPTLQSQLFAYTKHDLRLLEKVACCVRMNEPVILVGETGAGKTTSVQELATLLGKKLIVQNLSLSTDTGDLLGGYRPVTMRQLILPCYEKFVDLFQRTFTQNTNEEFLQIVAQIFQKQQWKKLIQAFQKASTSATKKLYHQKQEYQNIPYPTDAILDELSMNWSQFSDQVERLEINLPKIEHGFAFAPLEGLLLQAMKKGHWLLLDEINLASSETLQSLTGLLDGQEKLTVMAMNSTEPIIRHPEFRVFAAMNPPTDVGKRELPYSLRSRFTEIFTPEMLDSQDLENVVHKYMADYTGVPVSDIVSVYLGCRSASEMSDVVSLADGGGHRPHYSLRSLTRSMRAAKSFTNIGIKPITRALFEGFLLNFQTSLAADSGRQYMWTFLKNSFNAPSEKDLNVPPSRPGGKKSDAGEWVLLKPFWLRVGPLPLVDWAEKSESGIRIFVITKTVETYLRDICAAVAAHVAPILLQGPTSVGKTTMIEYLAARTGHKCVRINNHEHTDVQEYIGGYVTNDQGKLEFRDGLLVEALRQGHWIILDELNLAPSDVLEALNRLLDDNKELLIPETGELVHPVDGFRLFATQNPPGAYGGRKPLSRAFRNRFLELCVSDLPHSEVEEIVTESCGIPPKFSKVLVSVMKELQIRRQQSNLFSGKHGSVTTRDLIKWGRRQPATLEALAIEGYMLLAEKLRTEEEQQSVHAILSSACKASFSSVSIYSAPKEQVDSLLAMSDMLKNGSLSVEGIKEVAITSSLRRLWTLVGRAIEFNEPALLIGDTGSGKTTVCQLLTSYRHQNIRILNCHQSTETSDIIGGLRPVRGREAIETQIKDEILSFRTKMNLLQTSVSALYLITSDPTTTETLVKSTGSSDSFIKSVLSNFDSVLKSVLDVTSAFYRDSVVSNISMTVDLLSKYMNVVAAATKMILAILASVDTDSKVKHEPISKKQKKEKSSAKVSEITSSQLTEVESSLIQNSEFSQNCTDCVAAASDLESAFKSVSRLNSRYHALFEWQDGPLVTAMKEGDVFVLDEINLAEDAVIERLNSVLESSRSITLAEKGGLDSERIIAHPNFKFLATMNPGGDFGKRELSPALRSRFTEIFVPTKFDENDIAAIVMESLKSQSLIAFTSQRDTVISIAQEIALIMVNFLKWLKSISVIDSSIKVDMSVRELLAWSKFISLWISRADSISSMRQESFYALFHGIYMVLLDGLGIGASVPRDVITTFKMLCVDQLLSLCPIEIQSLIRQHISPPDAKECTFVQDTNGDHQAHVNFKLGFFSTSVGPLFRNPISKTSDTNEMSGQIALPSSQYVLSAKSTSLNLWRILRALQISRPILLEGPPGVGKSSIVSHLARITGHALVRINLSEHSEISDLLGTDLPTTSSSSSSIGIEDGDDKGDRKNSNTSSQAPKFVFCEGVFLTAMRRGDWVLLDELNLAPQSVLEGLNACLDHRGEVFLPELNRTVHCAPSFRVFCAQNPMAEGGGRKGLPQSFLSRFSRVFVEAMTEEDMLEIALQSWDYEVNKLVSSVLTSTSTSVATHSTSFANLQSEEIKQYVYSMVKFVFKLQTEVSAHTSFGVDGSPWEFNLRDLIRWIEFTLTLYQLSTDSIYTSDQNQLWYNTAKSTHKDDHFHYILNEGGYILFVSRFRSAEDREKVCLLFSDCFGFSLNVYQASGQSIILFNKDKILKDDSMTPSYQRLEDLLPTKESPRLRGSLRKVLDMLSFSTNLHWPVLIVGSSGSGKRRSVRKLAAMTGNRLVETCVTSSTDSTELLGSFEQKSASSYLYKGIEETRAALQLIHQFIQRATNEKSSVLRDTVMSTKPEITRLQSEFKYLLYTAEQIDATNKLQLDDGTKLIEKLGLFCQSLLSVQSFLRDQVPNSHYWHHTLGNAEAYINLAQQYFNKCSVFCTSSADSGGFEWVDGVVVEALLHGHWLLIDNINLCSASVLDRFNSLLERDGSLLLTESGDGRVVQAHPSFKVFFVMDPLFGEISRAMRNRCLELCLIDSSDTDVMSAAVLSQTQKNGIYHSLPCSHWNELTIIYDFLVDMNRSKDPSYISKKSDFPSVSKNISALIPTLPRLRLMKRFLSAYLKEYGMMTEQDGSDKSKRSAAMMRALVSVAPQFSSLIPDLIAKLHRLSQDTDAMAIISSNQYSKYMSGLTTYYSMVSSLSPRLQAAVQVLAACLLHPSLNGQDVDWLWSLSHAARDQSRSPGLSFRENVSYVSEYVDTAAKVYSNNKDLILTSLQECVRAAVFEILSGSDHQSIIFETSTMALTLANTGVVTELSDATESIMQHSLITLFRDVSTQMNAPLSEKLLMFCSNLEPVTIYSKLLLIEFQGQSNDTDHNSMNLKTWYLLFSMVNFVVLDRFVILEKERRAIGTVENLQTLSDPTQLSSVYEVAIAVSSGRIVSNSKECKIVSVFYDLLCAVDIIMISFVDQWENGRYLHMMATSWIIITKTLKQLLDARDMLAEVLLSEQFILRDTPSAWAASSDTVAQRSFLPWGKVLMCVEWIAQHTSELTEILQQPLIQVFRLQAIESSVSKVLRAVNSYFGHTLCSEARSKASQKVWEETGHPAVPSKLDHWQQLDDIKTLGDQRIVSLPSFLETDISCIGSLASHGSISYPVVKDWVSLLASFYYSCTNEASAFAITQKSSGVLSVTGKVDLAPIFTSVNERMHRLVSDTADLSIEESEEYMQDELFDIANGGDSFLLFNKNIRKKVSFELEAAADLTKTIVMEPGLLESFYHISNQLASVLSGSIEMSLLSNLSADMKVTIQLILRYTLFDPTVCRELQSLVWCIDAFPKDLFENKFHQLFPLQHVAKHIDDSMEVLSEYDYHFASLISLVRSTFTKIDQWIYLVTSQNLSNFMSINMCYGSQTLQNILTATSRADILYIPSMSPSWLATALSGPTRGLQMHSLELILRQVDAKALHPAYFSDRSKGVFNFLTVDSAAVNVSTCYNAKKKLSQLFRTTVAASNATAKRSISMKSQFTTLARLDLLKVHIVDIIMSCRHMFESSVIDGIIAIASSSSTTTTTTTTTTSMNEQGGIDNNDINILTYLSQLNLPSQCTDPEMSELLNICYRPALEILLSLSSNSEGSSEFSVEKSVRLGRAWVSIGLLRAHLSMLTAPVDPTSRPAAQASLLTNTLDETRKELILNHFVSVFESSTAVTSKMIDSCNNIKSTSDQIYILKESAVERPEKSAPFEELFFELKSMIDSICDISRVLSLIDRIHTLVDKMSQNIHPTSTIQTKYFDELKSYASEENNWQGSAFAFIKRSNTVFPEYDDVLTPFLSALQNISFGLRMAIGPALSKCEVNSSTHSHTGSSDLSVWWSSTLQFPFVTQVNLGSSQNLTQGIESSIASTLKQSKSVVYRAKTVLSSIELNNKNPSMFIRYPKPEILNTKTAHLTLLLALSQINYYVGNGGLPVNSIYDLFRHSLTQFIEAYLLSEKQRRQKEAEKAEMFKYKKTEKIFESNEEREEAVALEHHFPDHLKDLKKQLGIEVTDQLANETIDFNAEDDENDINEQGQKDDKINDDEFILEAMFVDRETTRQLTKLHAQMIFIHKMVDLNRRSIVLSPIINHTTEDNIISSKKQMQNSKIRISSSNQNKPKDMIQNLYALIGPFNDQMSKVALLTAKSVEMSIRNIVAPDLANRLEGGGLMMLGTMVTSIDTTANNSNKASSQSSSTDSKRASWMNSIDRDLLLLLDGDTAEDSQRPLNFHLDANPTEIVRATKPLLAIFNRAADLLVQYPGNELLLQVCKLSAVINDFHISTTLGKMLLSLEMLLRKAEEWEKFAAKHSSLQAEMTILSELIAMWRELELKSWQQLLRTKELEYSDDALNYWFVLAKTLNTLPDVLTDEVVSDVPSKWPSLVRDASIWIWGQQYHSSESVIEPNPTDPKQTHPTVFIPKQFQAPVVTTETSSLKTTFDTLDGFLRSSNVGQFPTRLHLVRLFALQLSQEALHSSGSSSDGGQSGYDVEEMKTQLMNAESTAGLIEKVSLTDLPVTSTSDSDNKSQQAVITYKKNLARVVFGIWEFYQQYLSVVRKFQDTLKAPLQVKAKDQANIGKWDKINSYALIEHSERVHRKLNTLLREYQSDVMEYPISAVLSREIMRGFTSDTGDLAAANLIPSTKDTFPQVLVLGECLPTYKPIVDTQDDDVDNEEEGEVEVEVEVVVKAQNKVTPTIDVSDEPDPATIIHISDTGSQFLSRYTSSKHQQSRSFIFTVSESLHSPILETFPRLQRVGKLCKKTDTIVTELLYIPEIKLAQGYQPDLFIGKVRYGIQGAFLAEELSLEVFSRLDSLRATHVNKSMKYRAVADLLSSLKEQGISPYLGTVPAQCRSMQQVLSSSAPLVCESAGDLAWFVDSPKNVVEHGERYFVRNSSELNQMRTQVAAPSARDVPLRDAQLMLGLSENFFFQSLKTRSVLAASLTDLKEIAVTLRTVDSFSELPSTLKTSYPSSSTASTTDVSVFAIEKCAMLKSQLAAEAYFQYFSPSCSLIVKGIHELLSLVRVGVISHSDQMIEEATVLPVVDRVQSQEAIGKLTKVIDTLVSARDSILSSSTSTGAHASNQLVVGYYCPLSEPQSLNRTLKSVRDTYAFASKSLNLLLEVRECVGELVTTNVCDSVIKKVEEWLSTLQSHHAIVFPSVESEIASISVNTADPRASDDMSSSILTHLSQCVDECLLAVQKVQSLANLRCLSAYDAALQQGRPTTDSISGCFGETFVRKSASVISSATDVEISDGADVTEATLSDCVSLGQTSVASVGIHLHRINQHLLTIISYFQSDCTSNNSNILSHSILTQAVLELVSRVKDIFAAQVDDLCSLYKSQNKFLYVCLRIFRTLLAKGLCSDETKEGDGDGDGNGGDMTFEDDVDGTGMGEGEGRKDVSDQIETEDQLMGLKNQNELEEESKAHNQESKKMDDKEEDNAVEMTQDFDGEMYDMPADERDQNKDDDDDDEGIDQEELEREIGEADKDDIVDEKQWDNDDEEDEGGTDGKKETFEKDSQMKGPSLEDELRTKEDDEDDGSEKGDNQEGEPESDKKKEEQPRDNDADDGKGEDKINQQDDEEVLDKPMGVDVEEKKPKPDTSDDVDDNDKDEGDEGGDEGLDPNGENDIDNGDDAADGDDLPDDMNLDADDNDNQDDEDQNEDTADDQMNEDMIDTEVPEPDNQSDAMEEDTAEDVEGHGHQPQSGTGNIPDEQNPGDEEKPDEEMKPEKPLSKNLTPKPSRPPTFGDASADGDDAIINDEMQAQIPRQKEDTDDNFEGAADGPKGENSMTESAGRDGAAQSLGDQESNPMQQKIPRSEKPRDAPNPFRPGDVNEKWHRHLNMLDREEEEDDDTDEVIADPEKSNNESSQQVDKKKPKGLFEKASDNEESSDQVMDSTQDYDSPIPAPQHAAEDTNITEGNDDMKDEANDDDPMNSQPEISKDNEEETLSETRKRKKDSEKETSKVPRYKSAKKSKDETAQKNQESDRMLDDEDNHSTSDQDSDDEMSDNDEDSNESMNGDESNQLKTSKDMIHANNNFQFTKSSMTQSKAIDTMNDIDNEFVSKISLDDQNLILSRQLWSQYRQSTEAQSQRLCEQLRLILEATVASRLRGDYRTGKRLNMRKIISYVASGFRKDKIWLRRTEPAKREYQVMIMVDNSKSMTEAGPLAFSALSVITNALTKLEVGEVSLLSFAEQVHIVHPFGTPFDDEAGARAFAHFDFSAGRTLLGRSLDAVGPIFADALQASSSGGSRSQTGTTLQLCFVISDARIDSDNRQQLESTIRNLAEQNVLVLLVIIDQNINQGDSIFNTRSVEFVGNKVVTRAYMDSFPFPYYIVIQQVEGLSDVLSEALKQWFEMIRHQSGR